MAAFAKRLSNRGPIPAQAGIGLRTEHYQAVLASRPAIGFFEVHSENYFGQGGRPLAVLDQVQSDYPISLHGVGLSLGSTDPLSKPHLLKLKNLVDRTQPMLVSEHLCWSSVGGRYLNDLLPLPYTEESLDHVAARISVVQDYLGRELLIENVSSYLEYTHSTIPEAEFLAAVANQCGCGILLDVNNVYVSATNHGWDIAEYFAAIPTERVKEIHLAGFTVKQFEGGEILIDTHNRLVASEVWALYRLALLRFGRVPTLIEWDTDLPPLEILLQEAAKATDLMKEHHADAA